MPVFVAVFSFPLLKTNGVSPRSYPVTTICKSMTFSVASSSVSIVPFAVITVVRRRDLIFSSDVNSFFAHDMHGHSRIHNNVSKMILKVKVSSIPMLVRSLGRNVPRYLSNSLNHVHASCRVQSSAIGVKLSFRSSDV